MLPAVRIMRHFLYFALLSPMAATAAHADEFPPDLVVFCEPTLRPVLAQIGELWQNRTGVPVRVIAAPTPLLLEQLYHHIRSDLIVAQGDPAQAVERHLIKPETRFDAWRNRLVVAQEVGQAANSWPAVLHDGKNRVALVDEALASEGKATQQALESGGLLDAAAGRSIGTADTADAAFLLTTGVARFAVIEATDLAADPSLTSAGTLADESYPAIRYWIAQTSATVSPDTARFEAFLRDKPAQEIARRNGLEVLP
ncbi:MAG: substrate-binding domain-containing protein [Aliidongia sp.]